MSLRKRHFPTNGYTLDTALHVLRTIWSISSSEISRPLYSLTCSISSVSKMLHDTLTGTMNWPFTIATLAPTSPFSTFGGTRWMRTTPGPSGFSVVW